jgi:error-prone DNA polymerase
LSPRIGGDAPAGRGGNGGFYGSARAFRRAGSGHPRTISNFRSQISNSPSFLPILCVNRRGYSALCQHLTDRALTAHGELQASPGDFIALTGGRSGPVAGPLLRNDKAAALAAARMLIAMFGQENVYVEINRHHLRGDERLNRLLIDLARHLRLPLIASNAPLHATRADRMLADAFTCLRHHTTLDKGAPC